MIIYTAIVGMILATVIYVTSTTYNVRARVASSSIVHESMEFATKRIIASLHDAEVVLIPANGTSSTLQLSMSDSTQDPTTYSLSNGQILLKEGTKASLPLTSSEVMIKSLQFIRGTSTPAVIQVIMAGDRKNAKASYSAPFSVTTSAAIRQVN